MKKRVFSIFLALVLCMALLPTAAFAEGGATEENAAAVVNGTDYYSSFDAAYDAAKDGDTIRLLQDTDSTRNYANVIRVDDGKSLTLDLNGHRVYRTIEVYGTLTLTGSDDNSRTLVDIKVLGKLIVTGTLRLLNDYSDSQLTLGSTERAGALDVRSDSAVIYNPIIVIDPGDTKLAHGKYRNINTEAAGIQVLDLLADGYAFRKDSSTNPAIVKANVTELNTYTYIAEHKHSFSSISATECACGYTCNHQLDPGTGACSYCHTQFKKARIGSDFYDSLGTALTAAQTQENCTVTLLCDTSDEATVSSGTFTIDLGGHTWKGFNNPALKIEGNAALTVQNGTMLSASASQFSAAIKLNGGSLTAGKQLICRGTYGIYIGSDSSVTLADDTVLLGGVYFLAYGKAPADLLPTGTAFAACSVSGDGTVNIGTDFVAGAYNTGSLHADMAVAPHTHDFGTGTCVCGLTAAAEVNGTVYQTLAAAIEAANGNIVKLLADNAGAGESITVAADKTLTVELNGKMLAGPVTILGTLRLDDQSDSGTNGTVSDLTVNGGALEIQSGKVRVTKLTAVKTGGIRLDRGWFHEVRCPEGETLLSVLKEGCAFKNRAWNQNSFANQASFTYTEVVECDHRKTINTGERVYAFEDYHCQYCNYACTHDQGFPPVGGGVGKCPICGFSAAAYVMVGLASQTFASLDAAIAHANSSAAGTTNEVILQLYTSPFNSAFTATGRWTLDFKQSSLNGANITVGSDGTAADLTLRKDYGTAETGTVTVTSGSKLSTEKLDSGSGQFAFTSLTVQNGASASLGIGRFQSIRNENTGGTLADLLPSTSYAFVDTNSDVINAYNVSTADNVTVVPHTHNIAPETHACVCGFVCYHSGGYLNGVCKNCGLRCPHPLDQNDAGKNECKVCHAALLATMTPAGGTPAYFSDLSYAFDCVLEGGKATITLLQDALLFGVNLSSPDAFGANIVGNACVTKGRTVTLDLNGHTLNSDAGIIRIGSDDASKAFGKLILTGEGDLLKLNNSHTVCIMVENGALATDGWNGRMDDLLITSDGASVQLSGGTFGKIGNGTAAITLGGLLADGYAFRNFDGEAIGRSEEIVQNGAITNLAVARCVQHKAASANDPCIYCGTNDYIAQMVVDGKTTYYTDLQAALSAAKAGDTLTLLNTVHSDLGVTIDKAIILDLNGHNIQGLQVQAKATIKDSGETKGTIGTLGVFGNGLTLGDLPEQGYAFRRNSDNNWVDGAGKSAENVTVQQAPITSVTLTALNADNTAASTTMPYGTTGGIKLFAHCNPKQGVTELSCQWYTIGDSAVLIDGAKGTEYHLPDNLSVGEHNYRVTATADGYSKSADITITVEKIDLANAEVTIDPWHADGKFRFYPYASETAALAFLSVVKVTANGEKYTLSSDDYTYTGATATRVGKYTLTITATPSCANFKGSKVIPWEVIPHQLYRPVFQGSQTYTKTYDGTTTLPGSYTWLAEFYGKEGIDQNVTLKSGDYEVTAAEFVSADAGKNKPINQTITLKNENFVFSPTEIIKIPGITTTDKTLTYTNFTPKEAYPTGGTTFNIEKATVPDVDNAVTLKVINDHADTYTVDLAALLPKLTGPMKYGDVAYALGKDAISFSADGYYKEGTAKIEGGKLILPIQAVAEKKEGSIGKIAVTVSSTNIEDFALTIHVSATNKIVSTGGGGGGSSSGSSNPTVKSETATNPDGSVTKTEAKKDGTVIETTTGKDGSVTKTETRKDGSSVTESKTPDGSTGTVKTDKDGNTEASVNVSSKAVEEAKTTGNAVQIPAEVAASKNSSTAPTVSIELPKNAGETKVEIPVSNANSGTVAVLVHPDGTEEILKNSLPTENGIQLKLDSGATVKIVDNSKPFIDTQNHWAKDEIDFVSARELVNGISATRYAPNATATRAQLWTILARQNDADLSGGANWYEKAQLWSKDKGISDGTNPNAAINRAQMVTMLWRTMGQPAATDKVSFADVPAGSYYAQAVAWAVESGITQGIGGGRFDPNGACTRAQIAAFLARYMK